MQTVQLNISGTTIFLGYYTMETEIMVKNRSERPGPFDVEKKARAISRAGVPYSLVLEIAKAIRNNKSLAYKSKLCYSSRNGCCSATQQESGCSSKILLGLQEDKEYQRVI
jgi:hypothetical protein